MTDVKIQPLPPGSHLYYPARRGASRIGDYVVAIGTVTDEPIYAIPGNDVNGNWVALSTTRQLRLGFPSAYAAEADS